MLPFLYQTKTILRLSRLRVVSRSRFKSDYVGSESSNLEYRSSSPREDSGRKSNDKDDARSSPKPRTPHGSSGDGSTITTTERRAFETINRLVPRRRRPAGPTHPPPRASVVDTDLESILDIFTSSLQKQPPAQDAAVHQRRRDEISGRQIDVRAPGNHVSEHESKGTTLSDPSEMFPAIRRLPLETLSQQWSLIKDVDVPTVEPVREEAGADTSSAPFTTAHKARAGDEAREPPRAYSIDDLSITNDFFQWIPATAPKLFQWIPATAPKPRGHFVSRNQARSTGRSIPEIPNGPSRTLAAISKAVDVQQESTTERPADYVVEQTSVLPTNAGEYPAETSGNLSNAPFEISMSQLIQDTVSAPENGLADSLLQAVRDRLQAISQAFDIALKPTSLRSDIAMWQVVESEILSITQHFQLNTKNNSPRSIGPKGLSQVKVKVLFTKDKSDDPRKTLASIKQRENEASIPATTLVATPAPPLESSVDTSSETTPRSYTEIDVLHNVYPAAVLLALRLFMFHHPTSPYPFLLLPRLRALGTTSYVLGASSSFYNSLMSLVWQVRSSLREVDALLQEMRRGGVEMDEETYAVLDHIEAERSVDLEKGQAATKVVKDGLGRTKVTRGAAWWNRQEQMLFFPRTLNWLDDIAGRLAAKERADSDSEDHTKHGSATGFQGWWNKEGVVYKELGTEL